MIAKDSFDTYRKAQGINASMLKSATSPRALHKYLSESREPSESMKLGSLFHSLLLEGHSQDFIIAPDLDRRTKAGKEAFAEFEASADGKTIVTQAQFDKACEMLESLETDGWVLHPFAEVETSLYLDGKKCRFDAFLEPCDEFPSGIIWDIKTAKASDFRGFQSASYAFGYDIQAFWYTELYKEYFGTMPEFRFLVIEPESPYIWQEFSVDETFLNSGFKRTQKAFEVIERYNAGSRKGNETKEIQLLTAGGWW